VYQLAPLISGLWTSQNKIKMMIWLNFNSGAQANSLGMELGATWSSLPSTRSFCPGKITVVQLAHSNTSTCWLCPFFKQHHFIGFKYDIIGYWFFEVSEQSFLLAGTFHCSNYLVTVKQHPSKVHRPHSLHQVEQVAFDALLRKMPDIIIDFCSVVPVQFSAIFLSFCDEPSGFARREHSHDAGARVDFHRESAGAADIF
jgi:hypothetical protein